ncbi:hypothetical protein VF02_06790 [Nostoc linckia z1]|nr:hypothetical protein VF02_06790 [Nostoc linckia z1]
MTINLLEFISGWGIGHGALGIGHGDEGDKGKREKGKGINLMFPLTLCPMPHAPCAMPQSPEILHKIVGSVKAHQ